MRLFLPRAVEQLADKPARPKIGALPRGSERILLVEDNEHVRATAVDQLTSLGYGVTEAESGDAALALLESGNSEFDLIFTDMVMPGHIDGYELAETVLKRWPDNKILLTSGFQVTSRAARTKRLWGSTCCAGPTARPSWRARFARRSTELLRLTADRR